jgi:hypothetical protein
MDPSLPEADPTVPRSIEEVASEETPDVLQDGGLARRVQAMAAVVQTLPAELEASCVTTNHLILFEHGHPCPTKAPQLIGCP